MTRILASLYLLCLTGLHAQTPGRSSLLTVNDGLSQGMVFDILQSRDGFIWIATKDGLNRFDGYRFEVFTPDPFDPFAIAGSEIRALYQDKRGWIWVVFPGKLDVFDPSNHHFFHIPSQYLPGFVGGSNYGQLITEWKDGTICIADNDQCWLIRLEANALAQARKRKDGLLHPDCEKWQAKEKAQFNSAFHTSSGQCLLGSNQGIYRFDSGSRSLSLAALPGAFVQLLGEDKSGRLWIYSTANEVRKRGLSGAALQQVYTAWSGIWTWDFSEAAPKKSSTSGFEIASTFDSDGYFWSLQGHTLRKWHPETLLSGGLPEFEWTWKAPDIPNPGLHYPKLTIDRSGIPWLGTSGYGLLRIVPLHPKFYSCLPVTSQRILAEDPQGNIFMTEIWDKLFTSLRFDRYIANPWIPEKDVNLNHASIAFDLSGNAWVNNNHDALYRIQGGDYTMSRYPWTGKGLLLTRKGKLLSISEKGIYEMNPVNAENKFYPFDLPRKFSVNISFTKYLYEDGQDQIWIFAFDGLLRATPSGTGFRYTFFQNNPADQHTLSLNTVLCVADDPLQPNHYLWVGTKGGGLNRLDKRTGQFDHFNTKNGLPDNVIYGILTDSKGNIWMSSNKGLTRMNTVAGKDSTIRIKNFTHADGLQSNEFNQASYLKTRKGYLIFGGVNGLTVFHPDSLHFNPHLPMTRIVGIRVNNIKYPLFSDPAHPDQLLPVVLSYHQNFIAFDFAALEYTHPAQNLYRYRLMRRNMLGIAIAGEWIDQGESPTVQLANLSPGHYAIEVWGSNNDGAWSSQPVSLAFTIRPPWWASGWAYLIYAIIVATAAWLYYRFRLQQRLAHEESLRLREMDAFKNRFFTNITHEFRTPLTVILGNLELENREIEKVQTGKPEKMPDAKWTTFIQFLRSKNKLIQRNAESLLRLINQLLDLAKLESNTLKMNYIQGDVIPYLQYIAESLQSLANAQNVMLRVESGEASIVMDYDPERMLQIVFNLLSNAIKFTPSGGKVVLRADLTSHQNRECMKIAVTDTGSGIPPEDISRIFDRYFQADNLDKAKAGGTGIGLALTKELVQALGGNIAVESTLGMGTSFIVWLPITREAPAAPVTTLPDPVLASVAIETPVFSPHAGDEHPVILLIEDNPDVVEYLASCLRDTYALDFAYNGRAGIEKALEITPDVIISDVMMPEKDGFEVLDLLKQDARSSHIPFILLTAKADLESRISGLKRGADAYIAKPFHREELLATVHNLLHIRLVWQEKYRDSLHMPASELTQSEIAEIPDPENEFLAKLRSIVEARLDDPGLDVEAICRRTGMSKSNLHKKLSALTGLSITLYVRKLRLQHAKNLLSGTAMNVSEVAFAVGFNDPKFFSRVFTEEFGVPPSTLKIN